MEFSRENDRGAEHVSMIQIVHSTRLSCIGSLYLHDVQPSSNCDIFALWEMNQYQLPLNAVYTYAVVR